MKTYNPLESVVIIVQENHASNNYLGALAGANGVNLAAQPPFDLKSSPESLATAGLTWEN